MRPQMVIIMENTLSAMALRTLLVDIAKGVDTLCLHSLEEYDNGADGVVPHYFISDTILFRNTEFFRSAQRRTVVLTDGDGATLEQMGFRVINTRSSEQDIVRSILRMHSSGHPEGHAPSEYKHSDSASELSAREREVLALIVKGLINKEIADRLNISPSTVIFHRNNICEKLNTRSIGRLTIYAVLNNIISLKEI